MGKKNNFYYDEKNPRCNIMEINKSGYPVYKDTKKPVHRHLAWKYLLDKKRALSKEEEVHHVDGDKFNYNPNNLIILSKNDHWKISKRLHKEMNLNKANSLVFLLALIFFIYDHDFQWQVIDRIVVFLLFAGLSISVYPDFVSKFMKKTRLYKVINSDMK